MHSLVGAPWTPLDFERLAVNELTLAQESTTDDERNEHLNAAARYAHQGEQAHLS
jgi:hypothetical protein